MFPFKTALNTSTLLPFALELFIKSYNGQHALEVARRGREVIMNAYQVEG